LSRRTQLLVFSLLVITAAIVYFQSLQFRASELPNGANYRPVDCWFESNKFMRVECGYMTTRTETHSDATFELPIVVLRHSLWRNSESPMLHIAGGPGGAAYIDAKIMPFWIQNFIHQDWGIDFVIYDQRGTGLSKPRLTCPDSHSQRLDSLKTSLTAREDSLQFIRQMQECYEALMQKTSLSQHMQYISTDDSVNDIADLHSLLGIEQWVLMGVSYGTRLSLEFVRRYPALVKSMVLDSVYPPRYDGFETLTENGLRAIERLLESCRSDVMCDEEHPMLSKRLNDALLALKAEPLDLSVPQTEVGKPARGLSLTPHRLILLLDYASYDSSLLANVPAAISAVVEGDLQNKPLLELATNYLEIELFEEFSEPVYMITECKENGQFSIDELMERLGPYLDRYPMLDWSEQAIYSPKMCEQWKDVSISAERDYRKPVVSDIPTLILAGALDSITPPEWGRSLAKTLSNSRYLEYPESAHSVLSSSICSNDEVQVFLNPEIKETAFCDAEERLVERSLNLIVWAK